MQIIHIIVNNNNENGMALLVQKKKNGLFLCIDLHQQKINKNGWSKMALVVSDSYYQKSLASLHIKYQNKFSG